MNKRHVALALVCAITILTAPWARAEALAQEPESRQSLDDAWWTGPLLASSPVTGMTLSLLLLWSRDFVRRAGKALSPKALKPGKGSAFRLIFESDLTNEAAMSPAGLQKLVESEVTRWNSVLKSTGGAKS